jgi:putative acetyltransferase
MSGRGNATETVTVRPLRTEDGPALHQIAIHPQVARRLLRLPSMEFNETERWVRERQPGQYRLVAVRGNRAVGLVTLIQPMNPRRLHSANLGLMVHPDHWGTGVGTALMDAVLTLADAWLNLRRVSLGVLENNTVAEGLYHKFGFEREGVRRKAVFADGRLHDEIMMARLREVPRRDETKASPVFPRRQDVVTVTVRPLKHDDAEPLHDIIADPAVARGLNQLPSLELSDVQAKIDERGPGLYRYSAVAQHEDGTQKVVGNLTLRQPQNPRLAHSADLGLSVHRDYWGIGIGQRLMATAVDLADNWINLQRLELSVYTDNPAAIRLYGRFGFEIEGTQRLYSYGAGRWADAHVMARLHPTQVNPSP